MTTVTLHLVEIDLIIDPRPHGQVHQWSWRTFFPRDRDRHLFEERLRQLLWEQVIRGLVVFGAEGQKGTWPFYQVTEYGQQTLSERGPQPYDPDGFIQAFRERNESVDPIVAEYLEEAVQTFNAGCYRATAVMLGAASAERQLLLPIDDSYFSPVDHPVTVDLVPGNGNGSTDGRHCSSSEDTDEGN